MLAMSTPLMAARLETASEATVWRTATHNRAFPLTYSFPVNLTETTTALAMSEWTFIWHFCLGVLLTNLSSHQGWGPYQEDLRWRVQLWPKLQDGQGGMHWSDVHVPGRQAELGSQEGPVH